MSLFELCHVNSSTNEESFVGIRADSNGVNVYFPVGYNLPETEQELRYDILHLISILREFSELKNEAFSLQNFNTQEDVSFPLSSYIEIIDYFMVQNSYFTEKEHRFNSGKKGRIAWPKTIQSKSAIIQTNGSVIYNDFILRSSALNEKNIITQIHKYCVFESFSKVGWLFTPYLPEKPAIVRNDKMFLSLLREKLSKTYNDVEKRLFSAMISMIEYLDKKTNKMEFCFGTEHFEYIWEKLIDNAFSIKEKQNYFPRTYWKLHSFRMKKNSALVPDSIMFHDDKIYVLDAKYYKYGSTASVTDLPESSSINKQITYGEYVYFLINFEKQYGKDVPIFNAFIMPFNAMNNLFGFTDIIVNIGEATGDWKVNGHKYERVQGILVDTRYLMYHYNGRTQKFLSLLAQAIEKTQEDRN